MIHQPPSAGPVRCLLTGHLWTSPHLSARDKFILTVNLRGTLRDMCNRSKHQNNTIMSAETHLSGSFDITVHEEALNGVGLGYSRFLHIFLGVRSFSACFPFEQNIFTKDITLCTKLFIKSLLKF